MKNIKIFLIFIFSFTFVNIVSAEDVVDSFGPELVSVTMSKNEIMAGETVSISFETTDDLSGTEGAEIIWCFKSSDLCEYNERLRVEFEEVGSNNFVVNYTLPSDIKPGEWVVSEVSLIDKQYNSTWYYSSSDNADISSLDFEAINSNYVEDIEAPVLRSVNIIKNTGPNAPYEMRIQMETSDNISDEVEVHVIYDEVPLGETGVMENSFSCNSDGTKVICDVGIFDRFHKYYLWAIRLIDESGNMAYYGYDIDLMRNHYGSDNSYGILTTNLDLIPDNFIIDNTAPGLRKFEHNKTEVSIPSLLVTYFDLEIDGAYFDRGEVCFKSDDGSYDFCDFFSGEHLYLQLYDNFDYGSYIYVYKVVLEDSVGNKATYSIDNGDFEKEKIKVIKENKTYDVDVECFGNTYISKITSLTSGNVMCRLDWEHKIAKKEVFDAIKGKDIEVTFRTNEGYEWIINGLDIVNETKDVNLEIKLELIPRYFLRSYKFPDLVSPPIDYEPAEGEGPFDFWNKQKEKPISDYFDYLKSIGYKNTDAIKKKALKSIYTLGDADYESIIAHATGNKFHMIISFYENGLLPGEMTVRVRPDVNLMIDFNEFKNLYLYYVENENDNINFDKKADGIKIKSDDFYELKISHNSEYWLTANNMSEEFTLSKSESVPQTFDGIYYSIIMMVVSLLTLCGLSRFLKK